MSGGPKAPTDEAFLAQVRGAIDAGATGIAVGRNVWQHPEPLKMADLLRQVVFENLQIRPRSNRRRRSTAKPRTPWASQTERPGGDATSCTS